MASEDSWESIGRDRDEEDLEERVTSWDEEDEHKNQNDGDGGGDLGEGDAERVTTDESTSTSGRQESDSEEEGREEEGQGEDGEGKNPIGVAIGAGLLLGATLGLGVGVGVAALATVASRQLQNQARLLDRFGFNAYAFKEQKPLNAEQWCECCDGEGKVTNFRSLLRDIAKGGLCPTIRVTVWPFLLGLVDANSTAMERASQYDEYRKRYTSLLDQCKRIEKGLSAGETSADQADALTPQAEYKENKRILNLDVIRTDFSSMSLSQLDSKTLDRDAVEIGVSEPIDKAEYLSLEQKQYGKYMAKLLLCYSIHDPPTGYCQGMTDLIQPFAQIFQEEAMSFWSFESFMKTARENFMTDESGIMTRIGLTKLVLGEVSKELFERLNDIGAGSFFFAYRMILVFLRRELNVEDSILFWEVLWVEDLLKQQEEGKEYVPEFLVFAIVALVVERADEIFASCKAESDVVHIFCNLDINVWHMIERARHVREKWIYGTES